MEPLKGNWRRFYHSMYHTLRPKLASRTARLSTSRGWAKENSWDGSLSFEPEVQKLGRPQSASRCWDVQLPKLENWKFKCNRLLINRHVLHTSDYTQINLTGSVFTVCECCRVRPGIIPPFHLDPWSQSRSKLALTSGSRNDNGKWRHGWTEMVVEESQPLKLLVNGVVLISFDFFCLSQLFLWNQVAAQYADLWEKWQQDSPLSDCFIQIPSLSLLAVHEFKDKLNQP